MAAKKQTILIVDDMRANVTALGHLLTPEWKVKIALDGENALRIASSEPQPDLVLLDIKMPKMDGYEVCTRLKQNDRTRKIPVIFISALNEEKNEACGLEVGAIDYISKPFRPPLVKARIRNHLQRERLTDEYERVFQGTQDAMFLVELTDQGEFCYIRNNQVHQQAIGMVMERHPGATPEQLFGPRQGAVVRQHYRRCLEAGKPISFEENINLTGDEKVWLTRLTPVTENGTVNYLVGASTDITEQKKAEQALADASRKEWEFETRIEKMLLTAKSPVAVRGADIAAISMPSRHLGGDFIDYYPFTPDLFDMIIGDVMGKGVQAALIGAGTKSLFLQVLSRLNYRQAQAAVQENKRLQPPDPVRIVALVNGELARRLADLDSFITLSYARFDLENKKLHYVDCGHPGILILRAASGQCEVLKGSNMALGFVPRQDFKIHSVDLCPDDLIVFYSDGLSEARDPQGEMVGQERLKDFVRQLPKRIRAEQVSRLLLEKVAAFTGLDSFADDFTCNVVRMDPDYGYQHKVSVAGSLQILPQVRSLCDELLAATKAKEWDEKEKFLFKVAVQEAVVNIIEHAFKGKPLPLEIVSLATSEWLQIRLDYQGEVYACDSPPEPDSGGDRSRELNKRGRGLRIMGAVMDEYKSEQADFDRVCITLIKYLK